ncbi:MAG: transglycosylase SLT domain-containing protein [Halieaceae bacterium]|jgi:soluble lytic murein transglycosylase-like protein|nr:transglycosylase SLT domain-containing protein [Halieaceae bacterium]
MFNRAAGVVPPHHRSIGQLLVSGGFINQTQLSDALEERSGSKKRLGEILEDRSVINTVDTRAILRLQRQLDAHCVALSDDGTLPEQLQLTLGQLLVDHGEITPLQLDSALATHQRNHTRLGATLVSQKSLTQSKLDFWLRLQRKLVAAAAAAVLVTGFASAAAADTTQDNQHDNVQIEYVADFNPEAAVDPDLQQQTANNTAMLPDSLGLSNFQKRQVERYTATAIKSARRFELTAELVMAMIHTESAFHHDARSNRAAVGLMQVVPSTGGVEAVRHVKGPTQVPSTDALLDPHFNIEVGTAYLAFLNSHHLEFVKHPEVRMLASVAAYNWGPTRLRQMFRTHGEPQSVEAFKQQIALHAPAETRNYIDRVEQRRSLYATYFATGELPMQLASASVAATSETA